MSRFLLLSASAALALALATAVFAGSADLDPTFDSDGKVTTDFADGSTDQAFAVAVQPDNKVIVVGDYRTPYVNLFAIVRYSTDGSLDSSFGINGKVRSDPSIAGGTAYAVALQPDGKVVVAGGGGDFVTARYNADGSADTGFESDGYVVHDFANGTDVARGLALQSNGRVVVAGESTPVVGGSTDFAVARYLPNGSRDPSFDSDGEEVTAITAGADVAEDVVIQNDGRIVLGGTAGSSAVLARYWSSGGLDSTFDGDGKVVLSTPLNSVKALALQSDQKILAAGGPGFGVTRFNQDGSVDTTFGSGGRAVAPFPAGAAYSVVVQPDGKIVVGGQARDLDFAAARFEPSGSLDPTFDGDGMVETDFGAFERAYGTGLAPDGRIVLAGVTGTFSDGPFDFAVARYGRSNSPQEIFCVVPKLRGTRLAIARRRLGNAHCLAGQVRRAFSRKVRKGKVISQSRRAGLRLPEASKVNLVLSKGRKP